jgi:signal transduction histidine kinase
VTAPAGDLKEELRACFLFESLDDEQLDWLVAHGTVEAHDAGVDVYDQDAVAEYFYVLLEGEIQLVKRVDGAEVVLTVADRPGAYAGATRAFIGTSGDQSYTSILRTVTRTRLFRLRAEDFSYVLQTWFPMAVHLLDGLFLGLTNAEAQVSRREKLAALGAISAGLAHELNNPAAAEVRAAEALRGRLQDGRRVMVDLAPRLTRDQFPLLLDLLADGIGRAPAIPHLSTLEAGDLEDALAVRLQDAGVEDAWDVAPALAAAGVDEAWLDRVTGAMGPSAAQAIQWLSIGLDIESLVVEIRNSAGRISELVGAMKAYSRPDQGSFQRIDIHEGLESTLVIFSHKLKKGIKVVRDYDATLPQIEALGGELNQVWTNIIHNAVDAMGGTGTLTVRTSKEGGCVQVEIGDTGPGIAPDVKRHIFDPFFTTKGVGQGTGLGLEISYRIVARRHHGDIRVESEPGDTRFRVLLPIDQPASTKAS